jgi:membrane fusion protein, macrolide-specific efflux system
MAQEGRPGQAGVKRTGKVVLVVATAAVALSSFSYWKGGGGTGVRTYAVRRGMIEETMRPPAAGRVVRDRRVDVAFILSGRVSDVHAAVGDRVVRDQVLATLDASEQKAKLAKAVADHAQSEAAHRAQTEKERAAMARFERTRTDMSQEEFERAMRDLEAIHRDVERHRFSLFTRTILLDGERRGLEGTQLRSPVDGEVVQVDAVPGAAIVMYRPVVTVKDAGCTFRVELDEDAFGALLRAQADRGTKRLDVRVRAGGGTHSGKSWPLVLTMHEAPKMHTVDIDLPGAALADGAPGEADFVIREEPEALKIPANALTDGTAVYVVDGFFASRRTVQVGARDGEFVEILAGLKEGEAVVQEPPRGSRASLRVRVTSADVPAKLPEEGTAQIRLDLESPTSGPRSVVARASQRFGSVEVPWPFARIDLEVQPGSTPRTFLADAEGRISLPALDLWRSAGSPGSARIVVTVRGRNGAASAELAYSGDLQAEDRQRSQDQVAEMRRSASRAETEGRMFEARAAYRGILAVLPEDVSAWDGLGRASERLGLTFDALMAIRQALVLDTAVDLKPDAFWDQARALRQRPLRERAVRLSRSLSEQLPPSPVARELLSRAYDSVKAGEPLPAYILAAEAQNAAPWWRETYRAAAFMFYAAWLQRKGAFDWDSWDFERTIELTESAEEAEKLRKWIENAKSQESRFADVKSRSDKVVEEILRLQKGGQK